MWGACQPQQLRHIPWKQPLSCSFVPLQPWLGLQRPGRELLRSDGLLQPRLRPPKWRADGELQPISPACHFTKAFVTFSTSDWHHVDILLRFEMIPLKISLFVFIIQLINNWYLKFRNAVVRELTDFVYRLIMSVKFGWLAIKYHLLRHNWIMRGRKTWRFHLGFSLKVLTRPQTMHDLQLKICYGHFNFLDHTMEFTQRVYHHSS